MINNFKDYGFIAAIILLIILNLTSMYYIRDGNNILNEKIINLNKEYNKKIDDDLVKSKNEYYGKISNIFSTYSALNSKRKVNQPLIVSKASDSQVSKVEKEQPKGNKELSDALNFNGYPNSIMFCYTSSK